MLLWRQPSFVSSSLVATYLLAVAALIAGQVVAGGLRNSASDRGSDVNLEQLTRASTMLFGITVLAYALWLISGIQHGLTPSVVLESLSFKANAAFASKATLVTIPGLTTATEFARASFPFDVWLWRRHGHDAAKRRALVLLGLAIARTVLNAERLALLELLVPAVLVLIVTSAPKQRKSSWRRAAPFGGLAASST